MKKYKFYTIILLLLVLIFFSCEKKISHTINSNIDVKKNIKGVEQVENNKDSCNVALKSLIINSSLKNAFKDKLNVDIESKDKTKITLRLFVETPDGEDRESNIGWVVMDLRDKKLLDITADIENPIELNYKIVLWNTVVKCYSKITSDETIISNEQKTSKIDDPTDSESSQEDIFQNTSISKVYADLIKNKDIEDADELLAILPDKTKNITLSQNIKGINTINYLIKDEISIITIYYDGGVNEIRLEKLKNNNVKRSIFHSAD